MLVDNDITDRIEKLEKMMAKYLDSDYFRYIRRILSTYLRLIDIYVEHGRISPAVIFPDIKDSTEREILEILFHYGKLNITQITEELRNSRGKASRNTVRKKINDLEDKGLLESRIEKGERVCYVAEYALKKWLKVLGIDINIDLHGDKRGDKNG